ncbi:hypothetical protein [uncultured Rhodospira sp.]|uniref:hypothetical protein n=1 Tax=uncultured Rhodospira sp. TaxID=1936189 RepID=UPI00262E9519|nr:hypothetical protein [uncultured Rhodospira sp.]
MAVPTHVIIRRRNDALIRAWVKDPLIQVLADRVDALPGLVFLDTHGAGASVDRLGRRSLKNVAVVKRPGPPDANASVWVRAPYASYRGAYTAFLAATYDTELDGVDLSGYDVDHLLNRARSPQSSVFIRVEAVRSEVNQAWGRLFEKVASDKVFWANQHRTRRTMSYPIVAKLGGQMPPTGPRDMAGLHRLALFFRNHGLDPGESAQGIKTMLDFAYRVR